MKKLPALEAELQRAWDEMARRAEAWGQYWGPRSGVNEREQLLLSAVEEVVDARNVLESERKRLGVAAAGKRRRKGAR